MALTRRSTQRMSGSIWPGFVDAMTALLLVLMFVLSIFMIMQGVLRETITGQENELDQLANEVTTLSQALGLAQQQTARLEDEALEQSQLIDNLTNQISNQSRELAERDAAIASFEERVATLLTQRDEALREGARLTASVEELEASQERLISEQEATQLALAEARDEIDAQTEAARLAAARREALEALTAELQAANENQQLSLADALASLEDAEAARDATVAELEDAEAARLAELAAAEALRARLQDAEATLSAEEQARLAEAAAAEALRERLESSEAELTAMSLSLEEQRREAEQTLTLLAAARAVEEELNATLAEALLRIEAAEGNLSDTANALTESEGEASELATRLATMELERDEAQAELIGIRARLSETEATLAAMDVSAEDRDARLAELTRERDALTAQVEELEETRISSVDLREQLAAALAAKLAAEAEIDEALTEQERQDALLATARERLAEEEALSTDAQRQVEALNQQVATLRRELGSLQNILDASVAAEEAAQVEIRALGSDLNVALARAAAEEKRRAELEAAEAERLRAEAERLKENVQELADYRSEFFGALRQVLGDRDGIQIVGDRFVFSSEVLFGSASADLSPEGRAQIANVASILADVADDIPDGIDWIIRVDGHTDDIPLAGTGPIRDNWELSQARALSVVKYMTDALGFPPDRLAATGFGEYRPVNTAQTAEARAQNRRIELKLTER